MQKDLILHRLRPNVKSHYTPSPYPYALHVHIHTHTRMHVKADLSIFKCIPKSVASLITSFRGGLTLRNEICPLSSFITKTKGKKNICKTSLTDLLCSIIVCAFKLSGLWLIIKFPVGIKEICSGTLGHQQNWKVFVKIGSLNKPAVVDNCFSSTWISTQWKETPVSALNPVSQ